MTLRTQFPPFSHAALPFAPSGAVRRGLAQLGGLAAGEALVEDEDGPVQLVVETFLGSYSHGIKIGRRGLESPPDLREEVGTNFCSVVDLSVYLLRIQQKS